MKVERVTVEMLRQFKPGESRAYQLPNGYAINSAKSSAYRMAQLDHTTKFSTKADYKNNTLIITRQ